MRVTPPPKSSEQARPSGPAATGKKAPTRRRAVRQRTICHFIQHYYQEHGWPPSRREIAQAVRIQSLGQVDYWLKALAEQGLLMITPHVSRGITLTEAGIALAEGRPVATSTGQYK